MLCDDAQLLLYFYALTKLFPDYETIFVTIFFVQDGGPFVIPFVRSDVERFLKKLRKRFETIRNTMVPRRIIGDASKKWKCTRLCDFHKNKQPGTDLTLCEYLHREVVTLGIDRVVQKHGVPGAWKRYGDGGGQANRDT
jgi:hypothetical protein